MNCYFQEVLDAHDLIQRWLGNIDTPIEVSDELLARFSPEYSMVTSGGYLLNHTSLSSFFHTQRGAKKGLKIDIKDMQLIAESEIGAIVTYQERQELPGQQTTLRFSTVVFELGTDNKVIWRHLHETPLSS